MRTGTELSAHLSGKRQHAANYLGRFFRISTSGLDERTARAWPPGGAVYAVQNKQ